MLNSVSTLIESVSEALFSVQRTLGVYLDMPEPQMGDEKGDGSRMWLYTPFHRACWF